MWQLWTHGGTPVDPRRTTSSLSAVGRRRKTKPGYDLKVRSAANTDQRLITVGSPPDANGEHSGMFVTPQKA